MDKNSPPPVNASYYIKPGFLYLASEPTTISAVLGSCVSVCLYDNRLKTGGMNHFLFPTIHEKNKATAQYGNVATYSLIRMMMKNGSKRSDLEAQLFGGAYNSEVSSKDIGGDNIKIAKKMLKKATVKITSEDIGGQKGRKVVFDTFTNEIAIVRVSNLRKSDWHPYDPE